MITAENSRDFDNRAISAGGYRFGLMGWNFSALVVLCFRRAALELGGAGRVSPPVGEPLADHAQQRRVGTRQIIHSECNTMIVTEVELGQIAVEMLLSAVLVDTLHAALEGAEEASKRVGMRVAANILTGRVVHGLMVRELLTQLCVIAG